MKKKIFLFTLAACLIILSIAGSSLAYFTDTDAKTNVFTAGNVDITLKYEATDNRFFLKHSYSKYLILMIPFCKRIYNPWCVYPDAKEKHS